MFYYKSQVVAVKEEIGIEGDYWEINGEDVDEPRVLGGRFFMLQREHSILDFFPTGSNF